MNELEMSMALGILPEPTKNHVTVDAFIQAEISYLSQIFKMMRGQKKSIGTPNPNIWCELVPWHSMN